MNRRDVLLAGLLAVGFVVLLVPFARIGVDMHHDGIMLKPALDVRSGQVLFRDTFMQYGALTCYIHAAALWIHPTLLTLKFLTVAAYGATLFILYASWRIILPRSLTVLSCLLFILFVPCYEDTLPGWGLYWKFLPWSSVLAMLFQSIGLYALFQVIRIVNPVRWGGVLGMACSAVYWCRQTVGLSMFGCLVVIYLALLWTKWTPDGCTKRSLIVSFWGGLVAVSAPLMAFIIISGAESEWWYQNYAWHWKWVSEGLGISWGMLALKVLHLRNGTQLVVLLLVISLPSVIKRFHPTLSSRSVIAYFVFLGGLLVWQHDRVLEAIALREGGWTVLFPVVIVAQALVFAAQAAAGWGTAKTTEYYLTAALAVFSLGSLLQFIPIVDSWHILWALAPTFGLIVFIFWRWAGWRPSVLVAALSAAFLPSVLAKIHTANQVLTQPLITLVEPAILRGSLVPPEQALMISQVMGLLDRIEQQRPGMPSVLIGDDAMILCFTKNLTNPSPYFVTWRRLATDEDNRKRWAYILRVRPILFLGNPTWKAVDDFYVRAGYVPLLYREPEELEIAVPQEVARAMGIGAYGASSEKRAAQ